MLIIGCDYHPSVQQMARSTRSCAFAAALAAAKIISLSTTYASANASTSAGSLQWAYAGKGKSGHWARSCDKPPYRLTNVHVGDSLCCFLKQRPVQIELEMPVWVNVRIEKTR
jgi:hypothetical protein